MEELNQSSPNAGKTPASIPWVTKITPRDHFFSVTDFSQATLSVAPVRAQLQRALSACLDCPQSNINAILATLPQQLTLTLFENATHTQNFVITTEHTLFIRKFFFQTLILSLKTELVTFLCYHVLANTAEQTGEAAVDTLLSYNRGQMYNFLKSRQELIVNHQDYTCFYSLTYKYFRTFIEALCFTAIVHGHPHPLNQLTRIEKKQLAEFVFEKKIKQLMGVHESAYRYIEKPALLSACSAGERAAYYNFKNLFETERESFTDFIHNQLPHKRILFWCCWTVSPIIAPDISRFLNILCQTRIIKKIYIDLPSESTPVLQQYLSTRANIAKTITNGFIPGTDTFAAADSAAETIITQEIEKIYPVFIPDYAKETLPYIVFMNTLKQLGFAANAIEAFGFDGNELMNKRPVLRAERLVFDMDARWNEVTTCALNEEKNLHSNELILFFYFLKPVYTFSPQLAQHERVARFLHTDPFTGFGPEKPINSLARYSQYNTSRLASCAFTKVLNSPLANESIIFYPQLTHGGNSLLDDSPFNAFTRFNALLYSTTKGDGGDGDSFSTVRPRSGEYIRH